MQYHDDGEKELDDLVATWSLGAQAEMFFRMKQSHAHPVLKETSYNPNSPVVMGSDFWQERMALNDSFKNDTKAEYRKKKADFFAKNREAISNRKMDSLKPWCLRLNLSHGDFVVMHGAEIHRSYEVSHRDRHNSYRARWLIST